MDFTTYQQIFLDILESPFPPVPYDNPDYMNYTKLNWSRQQRWLKVGEITGEMAAVIAGIQQEMLWTVITEPWCGDASHLVPFIHMIADLNPLIKVDYQLRDMPPFLIDSYLTNGSKSIPKLIIADKDQKDLAVWGPRPAACQLLYDQLQKDHADFEEKKIALQKWYNADKGESFQQELLAILKAIVS